MSTVKISELAGINLNSNTSNTILVGVDLPTSITGKITATKLAQGLYLNNSLAVGNNSILFPNTVAQFSGNSQTYLQVNLQNFTGNGSSDFVATADNGIDANGFINMGINGSTFSDPDFSSMLPNDGYLYVHGPFDNQPIGNLVIGTATSNAIIKFIVGGTESQNIVGYISPTGIHSSSIDNAISSNIAVIQGINLTQNTRLLFTENVDATQNTRLNSIETVNTNQNTSIAIIQGVNDTQNTRLNSIETVNIDQNTAISIIQGVNLTQNTNITTANNHAWAAFDKANNALANTSGTFAGDLNVAGTLKASGIVTLNNSTFATNAAFLSIVASDDFVVVPPSNTNYMIHVTGKANSVTRVVLDSFGVGANGYPLLAGRQGRGSAALPLATGNNDVLMRIVGSGYTGTQFPGSSPTKIDFVAAENFSDTNRGTRIEFWNTLLGSNTIQKVASFNANTVDFLGAVNPEKGFIYSPVIYPNAQTAITLDISDGPLVRAQTTSGLTVTLSNFVKGKVVELWVTNLAGSTQTFTHGVSAINATNGATTVSMPGNSTLSARYVCLDGTLANTMVAITRG